MTRVITDDHAAATALEERMSFQAYIDTVKTKTGMTPDDFLRVAQAKGLLAPGVKTGEIVSWLGKDYGLGRGHAMAIVVTLKAATEPRISKDDAIAKLFSGARAHWRPTYDRLVATAKAFGPDVAVAPTSTYVSLLRKSRKFAIVQVTADRLDLGLKLKGMKASGRFEAAGDWNSMVTHRVRIEEPGQIDDAVVRRLREAYAAA